ncbi:pentapeptide repeat-containing protein [Nocardia jiangxiensis]|uniref:Pentapeptide repeat-containing protein n=1 Tax=Nocardia jiangxiensis TaxID=282685 RepID=A0ABW6SF65_9NOCA
MRLSAAALRSGAGQQRPHQTRRHHRHRSPGRGPRPGQVEKHHEYHQNDREVRATIVRVIAAHLRPETEYSWSPNDFDFRTTYLEDADFQRATFSGATRFNGTTFSGTAWFDDATFSNTTVFGDATFSGTTVFGGATFSGATIFEKVDFGAQPISFANSKRWGPPAPVFDWSVDITLKPANVEPQDWPPVVVSSVPSS